MEEINKFILESFMRVPSLVLISILDNEKIMIEISKDLNVSYCHICKCIFNLEEGGFLTTSLIGGKRYCKLTEKGKTVASDLLQAKNKLDDI